MKVHILALDAPLEVQALRAAAEAFEMNVTVTWAGNADQIVEALSRPGTAELIILCGHGDARGLILPALADDVKGRYRFRDAISADDFASFVRLDSASVLNTSCAMGGEDFARAFLGGGAHAYIGADGYPDANATLMYALSFLYELSANGRDASAAHTAVRDDVDDRRMFKLYRADRQCPAR